VSDPDGDDSSWVAFWLAMLVALAVMVAVGWWFVTLMEQ
jgi:hypothetical protein